MYLDPGLGGMLIQLVVAVVAAGGAIVFMLRKKIRALFSKNKDSSAEIANGTAQGAGKAESVEDDAVDMIEEDD